MAKRTWHTHHPGRLIIAAFAVFIVVGTVLLWLPVSREANASSISVLDAFFTASSAVTVTGLTVVDTAATWSLFGELVILVLIQVGGLGIMTLAGVASVVLSRRLGLSQARLLSAEIGVDALSELKPLVRTVTRYAFGTELILAMLLMIRFVAEGGQSLGRSAYLAIFHSVSAFNNAGFSVIDGGLERYVDDWFLSLTIAGGFIAGGFGFPVVMDLWGRWRRPGSWALHTKLTLAMTGALLVGGTAGFLLIEWSNPATFGSLGVADKTLAAFFQSSTARTAGFNTIATGELRNGSLLVLILLMMIGASSASTGGGIKTSTVLVVIRSTIAEFRGDDEVTLFHRRIPATLQRQALALVVAALGTVGTATFLLALALPEVSIADLLFEAASAFGTVGLSTGTTARLDSIGKGIIIVLMFVGRVGPITFGSALLLRRNRQLYRYPEEQLVIG